MNLKYEVHVLNKELEIRNEEREYERKAADNAAKQHLESVKKITKLEEECSHLRVLIRKKLPGERGLGFSCHHPEMTKSLAFWSRNSLMWSLTKFSH